MSLTQQPNQSGGPKTVPTPSHVIAALRREQFPDPTPEESAFLKAARRDHRVLSVLADWLEDRQDQRAAEVRKLAGAPWLAIKREVARRWREHRAAIQAEVTEHAVGLYNEWLDTSWVGDDPSDEENVVPYETLGDWARSERTRSHQWRGWVPSAMVIGGEAWEIAWNRMLDVEEEPELIDPVYTFLEGKRLSSVEVLNEIPHTDPLTPLTAWMGIDCQTAAFPDDEAEE